MSAWQGHQEGFLVPSGSKHRHLPFQESDDILSGSPDVRPVEVCSGIGADKLQQASQLDVVLPQLAAVHRAADQGPIVVGLWANENRRARLASSALPSPVLESAHVLSHRSSQEGLGCCGASPPATLRLWAGRGTCTLVSFPCPHGVPAPLAQQLPYKSMQLLLCPPQDQLSPTSGAAGTFLLFIPTDPNFQLRF